MNLKLMYITNQIEIARIAEQAGVNRIWIDLETIGKEKRQPGDTVKSNHAIADIRPMKEALRTSELLVRVNPIHDGTKEEIEAVIDAGADIIMLPYYKSIDEVITFLECVRGQCRTCLLLETKEAHQCLDNTLALEGIDEYYIGLNDLHLSYKKKFMFELLIDGVLEDITTKLKENNMPFGFGGVARLGFGELMAEMIFAEHYRIGSGSVILSRSFCRAEQYNDNPEKFEQEFHEQVKLIRDYEECLKQKSAHFFDENYKMTKQVIQTIVDKRD